MVRSILTTNRTRSTWSYRQQEQAEAHLEPSVHTPPAAAPAESDTVCAAPVAAARSKRSRQKKTGAKGYSIADDAVKASINLWLVECVRTYACHSSSWALLLETRTLLTVSSLEKLPQFAAERIVVPNPDPDECAAMVHARPKLLAIPVTSHDLLSAISAGGDLILLKDQLKQANFGGAFHFAWLDYCGTMSSSAGRARQKDLVNLFAGNCLAHGSVLAVTFSCRGSNALYSHELVDSLLLLVQCLARDVQMTAALLGVVHYSISTPMYTIAFIVSSKAVEPAIQQGEVCSDRPSVLHEGVQYWHGSQWRLLGALVDDPSAGCPLWNAHHTVAAQFAQLVSSRTETLLRALVVDSKLIPVCTALAAAQSACGCQAQVTALVADPLDAMACDLLLDEHAPEVLQITPGTIQMRRQSLADTIEEWHQNGSPHTEIKLDALFLGYDNAKPVSMGSLQRSYDPALHTLRDLDELLEMNVLSAQGTLGVLIPYASTGECWEDSAVDWLVHGVLSTCARRGYEQLQVVRVLSFAVGPPRVALFLAPSQAAVAVAALPPRAVAKWREALCWDTARPKVPLKDAKKFKQVADSIGTLITAKCISHVVLHEPGFHYVWPELQKRVTRVNCCAGHDQVQENELRRRDATVVSVSDLCEAGDALILLAEGGCTFWRDVWFEATCAWLHRFDGEKGSVRVLALMVEASSTKGVAALLLDLEAQMQTSSYEYHRELETTIDNLSRRSLLVIWEIVRQ